MKGEGRTQRFIIIQQLKQQVSPLMKRRMPTEGGQEPLFNPRRNTDLDPHGKGIQSLHLDPILLSDGMTNKVSPHPDPQAGMAEPDITINQEAVPTPSHRKSLCLEEGQHPVSGGLGDHVQPTGDHLIEGEDLHFILHAGSLD